MRPNTMSVSAVPPACRYNAPNLRARTWPGPIPGAPPAAAMRCARSSSSGLIPDAACCAWRSWSGVRLDAIACACRICSGVMFAAARCISASCSTPSGWEGLERRVQRSATPSVSQSRRACCRSGQPHALQAQCALACSGDILAIISCGAHCRAHEGGSHCQLFFADRERPCTERVQQATQRHNLEVPAGYPRAAAPGQLSSAVGTRLTCKPQQGWEHNARAAALGLPSLPPCLGHLKHLRAGHDGRGIRCCCRGAFTLVLESSQAHSLVVGVPLPTTGPAPPSVVGGSGMATLRPSSEMRASIAAGSLR